MRVVVTLTSIPSREENVVKSVESIQNGTVKPDCIYVNLAKYYPKFKCGLSEKLVEKLTSMGVKVNVTDDYGTLTDIIPIYKAEKDSLVVIVTDNFVYSTYFLEYLLKGYKEFGCAVGYSGIAYPERVLQIYGRLVYMVNQNHGEQTDILETSMGFLIPMKQLNIKDEIILKPMDKFEPIYFSNDYIWSRLLDKKVFIKYDEIGRVGDDFTKIASPVETQPLHSLSREGNNLINFYNSRNHDLLKGLPFYL